MKNDIYILVYYNHSYDTETNLHSSTYACLHIDKHESAIIYEWNVPDGDDDEDDNDTITYNKMVMF